MKNSKGILALVAVIVALGLIATWQYRAVQQLKAENRHLKESGSDIGQLREENQRLSASQTDARELERLRKDQSELLRMRDEVSRLRQQLKEASAARTVPPNASATSPSPAPEAVPPVSPVDASMDTYQAVVRAILAPNQALITGGWTTGDGKRTFVVIQPELVTDAGQGGQVALQSRFVELPDEAASQAGWAALKIDGKQSTAQTILSEEQARATLAFLETAKDVDSLSSPKVSTLTGRQARMKSVSYTTIGGETYETGPTVDVVPHLSADRSKVEMTVIATLRKPAPSAK